MLDKASKRLWAMSNVFRTDSKDGDAEDEDPGASEEKNVRYWATTNLEMIEENQKELAHRV
jgi:hypothetical protein